MKAGGSVPLGQQWMVLYFGAVLKGQYGRLRLMLVLRFVCLRECGRFHEPEPKQCYQPEPSARAVRYSVGRAAVCSHRQVTASLGSASTSSVDAQNVPGTTAWVSEARRAGTEGCKELNNFTNLLVASQFRKTMIPSQLLTDWLTNVMLQWSEIIRNRKILSLGLSPDIRFPDCFIVVLRSFSEHLILCLNTAHCSLSFRNVSNSSTRMKTAKYRYISQQNKQHTRVTLTLRSPVVTVCCTYFSSQSLTLQDGFGLLRRVVW
jgi:hypothetical protein